MLPVVILIGPSNGETVKGTTQVVFYCLLGMTNKLEFILDGVVDPHMTQSGQKSFGPFTWNTKHVPNGSHVYTVRATTMDGQVVTAAAFTVNVEN